MNIEKIKADWQNKRCNPLVMIMGNLYKPSDDSRSASDFSEDNFQFCTRKFVDTTIKIFLAPILKAVSLQMGSTNSLMDATNVVRKLWANVWNSFNEVIQEFYKTFWKGGLQFRRVFEKLLDAYKRIGAILTASVYAGLSVINGYISLFDLIKQVVTIYIGILMGLLAVMFIVLIPLIPLVIMPTVDMMHNLGVDIPGAYEVFCFSPGTLIEMKDGLLKHIEEVSLGDELAYDCGKVTGFMEMDGLKEPLLSIDGIFVSASHIVWDSKKRDWVSAKDYEGAVVTPYIYEKLYVLNTTTSKIPLRTLNNTLLMAKDWEEIHPDDSIGENIWDWLVDKFLNEKKTIANDARYIPERGPLLGSKTNVNKKYHDFVSIDTIKLGDLIWDSKNNSYTRVLAVYNGINLDVVDDIENDWISDGNWIFIENVWKHIPFKNVGSRGIHLITESGSFNCWVENNEYIIRDFTEIGCNKIKNTYDIVKNRINLPKFK